MNDNFKGWRSGKSAGFSLISFLLIITLVMAFSATEARAQESDRSVSPSNTGSAKLTVYAKTNGLAGAPAGATYTIQAGYLVGGWIDVPGKVGLTDFGVQQTIAIDIPIVNFRLHRVIYNPVAGYDAEEPEEVLLVFGDEKDVTGEWVTTGTAVIYIRGTTDNDSTPPPAGATFFITGPGPTGSSSGPYELSITGAIIRVSRPTSGYREYFIDYSLVPDYWTPRQDVVRIYDDTISKDERGKYETDGGSGSITVESTIDGAAAAPPNGQFKILHDGGEFESSWRDLNGDGSGVQVADLDKGEDYTVQYRIDPDTAAFGKPTDDAPELGNSSSTKHRTVVGEFTDDRVTITVNVDPDESNGTWSWTGPESSSGGVVGDGTVIGPPGQYNFSFHENSYWTADGQTAFVDLGPKGTTTIAGYYRKKGTSLTINIANTGNQNVNDFGASWTIEQALFVGPSAPISTPQTFPLNGSGATTTVENVPFGTYVVTFNDVTSGAWTSPDQAIVTVGPVPPTTTRVAVIEDFEPSTVTGTYTEKTGDATINIADDSSTLDVNDFDASWDLTGTSTNGESINLPGSGETATLTDVPFGTYNVTFNDTTSGAWDTPASDSVTVSDSASETTGTYIEKLGSFSVGIASDNILNGDAVTDGGSFSISGTTDNGESFSASGSGGITSFNNVPWGSYTVSFNATTVVRWDTPGNIAVVVNGDVGSFTGTYIRHTGDLTVFIGSPDLPSVGTSSIEAQALADEGGWKLNGASSYRASGTTATGIPTGTVYIDFAPVVGFNPPGGTPAIVGLGSNTTVVALYNSRPGPRGSLTITSNDEDLKNLTMWNVGSLASSLPAALAYLKPGDVIHNVTAGDMSVDFNLMPGYVYPDYTSVNVRPGILNSFEANYVKSVVVHKSDYDGNGTEDLATYDATTRRWQVASAPGGNKQNAPAAGIFIDKQFGIKGDVMAPGDYDGDGVADLALYRDATGEWKVQGLKKYSLKNFGEEGDIPVPGDYNGDGMTDPALFRPTTGQWLIYNFDKEKVMTVKFGEEGDVPVPGNYDGDQGGMTDLAVFNSETGKWKVAVYNEKKKKWTNRSKLGGQYGERGDVPIHGDYDGDGTTDIAVYVRNSSLWKVKGQFELEFGIEGDIPVPNDWAGLGRVIPAIFRATSGRWLAIDNLLRARHGAGAQPLMSGR